MSEFLLNITAVVIGGVLLALILRWLKINELK